MFVPALVLFDIIVRKEDTWPQRYRRWLKVAVPLSLVVLVAVDLMLQKTPIGKAMRAVSDNKDLAAASGINVERVIMFVWCLGGGLAALGGVLLALSELGGRAQWEMGFKLLLLMFAGISLVTASSDTPLIKAAVRRCTSAPSLKAASNPGSSARWASNRNSTWE